MLEVMGAEGGITKRYLKMAKRIFECKLCGKLLGETEDGLGYGNQIHTIIGYCCKKEPQLKKQ